MSNTHNTQEAVTLTKRELLKDAHNAYDEIGGFTINDFEIRVNVLDTLGETGEPYVRRDVTLLFTDAKGEKHAWVQTLSAAEEELERLYRAENGPVHTTSFGDC